MSDSGGICSCLTWMDQRSLICVAVAVEDCAKSTGQEGQMCFLMKLIWIFP